jgi:hypothetical protein
MTLWDHDGVAMRVDCKHYETRTYATGEAVRKCNLDLAPNAPWRCPDACVGFERRFADVAWDHGSLRLPGTPEEPPGLDDGSASAVLDEAEDIVNAALPHTIEDIDGSRPDRSPAGDPWWRRFGFGRRR